MTTPETLLGGAGLGPRRTIEEWIRAGRRARAVGLDGRRLDLKPGEAVPGELLLYYRPVGGPGGTAVRSKPRSAPAGPGPPGDRKSTRLNSRHGYISYAVFCLKKKKKAHRH